MGVPLVTLSNSRAYVWSADLEGWACVADESFAVSQFMPVLSLAGQGECIDRLWLTGVGHVELLRGLQAAGGGRALG